MFAFSFDDLPKHLYTSIFDQMNSVKTITRLCILVILPMNIIAQEQELKNDTAYFNQQMGVYQEWLDSSGIGEVLGVREYEVKENFLTLYLEFLVSRNDYEESCLDTIITQWKKMKWHFDTLRDISLEQQLFYKQVSIMNLDPTQTGVAVFDNYNINEFSHFLRGMYFQDGEVKVEMETVKCYTILDSLSSPAFHDKMKKVVYISLKSNYDKKETYKKALNYLKAYAQENSCEGSSAVVRMLEAKDNLWLEVSNLCDKEWSTLLKDNRSIEKLYYLFTYSEDGELGLIVDGGVVNPQKVIQEPYTYISLGEEHKQWLEDYAQYFMKGLKEEFGHGKF